MALRARCLYTLEPGDVFELRDRISGTKIGVVERVPESRGYVRVRVLGSDGRSNCTDWSAGTLVYKPTAGSDMAKIARQFSTDEDRGDSVISISKVVKQARGVNGDPPVYEKKVTPVMAKIKKLQEKAKAKAAEKVAEPKVKAVKAQNPCLCGCGELANKRFKQGHDGRYYGYLRRVVAGTMKFDELNLAIRKRLNTPQAVKKEIEAHDALRTKNKAERG